MIYFVSGTRWLAAWQFYDCVHDDVIKWKHFPRYWTFVRGINRWPVNSPHKGQRRGALMFSLICTWVNNQNAGDLRRQHVHYDVIVLCIFQCRSTCPTSPRYMTSTLLAPTPVNGPWSITMTWSTNIPPGGRLNKKDGLTRYGDSHVKDKTS